MPYHGRAELRYATGRTIGRGEAELEESTEANTAWKGALVLDEVLDSTVLTGKMGDHFELRLLACEDEPVLPVIIRHIERFTLQLVGRDSLPECVPKAAAAPEG